MLHKIQIAVKSWLFRKWWVAGWDRWHGHAWWDAVATALTPAFHEDEI